MAWSTPRTWVDAEVVTAAIMNAHVRDNMAILETPRDASGRVEELSSATLADLSSGNVTGLATPLTGTAYTGDNDFSGGARFKVPVGADKWTGTKGVDAAGMWVEGDYLHHISSNVTTEWRYLGTFVSSTPGVPAAGSVWVEGNDLYYVDTSGNERRCVSSGTTGHSDAGALGGSAWIETYAHWVREVGTVELPGHADVVHSDHTDHDDHNDHDDNGAHSDSTTHDDVTHSPHSDHNDHEDFDDLVASEWVHDDYEDHGDHTDYTDHSDHSDSGPHDDHQDHDDSTGHNDVAADSRPVVV